MMYFSFRGAWLLPFCCCFALLCQAQPTDTRNCRYVLHGHITDGDHGEELPGAAVYIKELQTGAITDFNGEYTIKGLCAGTYSIVCQFVGFESREIKITISGNTTMDLKLFHKTTNLETVVVTAAPQRSVATLPAEVLEQSQLEALKGGTLGDALRSVSGVTTIQTGPTISKPVIHGLHSQRILLLNNGVRQEGQQWGAEHAPEIDPFAAGKITVVKGAATVRYGSDAVAGAILVEAPPMRSTVGMGGHVYGVGISNGRQGVLSVQLDGKPAWQPKLSWRLQGSVKKAGDLRAPDYFLRNTGVEELNGSAAARWESGNSSTELLLSSFNTRLGIYAGAHIGNLTDLQQVIASGRPIADLPFSYKINPPYQQVRHHMVSLKNRFTLERAGKLTLQYGLQLNQRAEFDRRRGDASAKDLPPDFELDLVTHTAEAFLEHRAIGPVAGTVGVSGFFQTNQIGGRRFLIPDYQAVNGGLFVLERWVRDQLTVEAGLRADVRQQRVYGQRANLRELLEPVDLWFTRLSGSAGLSYAPGHHWSWQLNAGTAWRAPSINELYSNGLHHGSASFEIGNEHLEEETSYSVSGAAAYSGAKGSFSVQPFAQYLAGYIFAKPLPDPILTIRGAFPAFEYTQTDALFVGADWSSRLRLGQQYELETNASVVRAQQVPDTYQLPFIPPARIRNMLVRKLKPKGRMLDASFGIGHQTVARQGRYQAGSDFMPPPAGYTLLQAEASARLLFGKQEVWLQGVLSNALNTEYRDYLNRFRYFADEAGRIFTFRVKVPFGKADL